MTEAVIDGFIFVGRERVLPKPEWWIERFLTTRSVAMISAQPKEAKSCFAAHLSHSVATGSEFCGRPVPRGDVLYLAGERANQVEDRLHELFGEEEPHSCCIFVPPRSSTLQTIKLNRPGEVTLLVSEVRELGMTPSLIVVDTLTQFFDGSQNDESAMHAFFVGVRTLCDAFGAVGLVIHHDTKLYRDRGGKVSGGGSPRGSGDAFASVDALIRARTTKNVADLSDASGKRQVPIIEFQLVADNFGGEFCESFVVKNLLEDPTPYLDAGERIRDDQEALMWEVLSEHGPLTTTTWRNQVIQHSRFRGKLSVQVFNELTKKLVSQGRVEQGTNPNRKNGKLYGVTNTLEAA